nr:Uncharacterised protein [Klebsiella pneumoniae]
MSEWLKEHARKVCIRQRIGVRIPSPPYFKKSSYESTGFFSHVAPAGDENPDRGSTTGNASWTDRKPASGLPRQNAGSVFEQRLRWPRRARPRDGPSNGERSESIPSPPYFKKSSYASTGFFSHVAPQTSPGSAAMPLPGYQTLPAGSPATRSTAGKMPKTTKPGLARALLTV